MTLPTSHTPPKISRLVDREVAGSHAERARHGARHDVMLSDHRLRRALVHPPGEKGGRRERKGEEGRRTEEGDGGKRRDGREERGRRREGGAERGGRRGGESRRREERPSEEGRRKGGGSAEEWGTSEGGMGEREGERGSACACALSGRGSGSAREGMWTRCNHSAA